MVEYYSAIKNGPFPLSNIDGGRGVHLTEKSSGKRQVSY